MKVRLRIKNKSHRYDINKPGPKHGYKYTKYKMCFSIMMVICIKQHLSNIWSSIYEKVKQHWSWVEKSVAYKKSVYRWWTLKYFTFFIKINIIYN